MNSEGKVFHIPSEHIVTIDSWTETVGQIHHDNVILFSVVIF